MALGSFGLDLEELVGWRERAVQIVRKSPDTARSLQLMRDRAATIFDFGNLRMRTKVKTMEVEPFHPGQRDCAGCQTQAAIQQQQSIPVPDVFVVGRDDMMQIDKMVGERRKEEIQGLQVGSEWEEDALIPVVVGIGGEEYREEAVAVCLEGQDVPDREPYSTCNAYLAGVLVRKKAMAAVGGLLKGDRGLRSTDEVDWGPRGHEEYSCSARRICMYRNREDNDVEEGPWRKHMTITWKLKREFCWVQYEKVLEDLRLHPERKADWKIMITDGPEGQHDLLALALVENDPNRGKDWSIRHKTESGSTSTSHSESAGSLEGLRRDQ